MKTVLLSKWKQVKLLDVSLDKGQYGSGASAIEYNSKKPRYVRITDIDNDGKLKSTDLKSPSHVEDKYFLEYGDFLFARSGSVGRTYLHEKNEGIFQYAGYLIRFKLNQKLILPKYLYYVTKSQFYWEWIEKQQKSVTIPNINAQQYASFKFLLPSIPVQKDIISTLDKIEKAKKLRNESNELTENLQKAIFLEIFGDPVKNPKGWAIKRLETICDKITDGAHHSPPNGKIGDFMYITAKNIKEDGIDLNNITFIDKKIHDEIYRRCDVKKDDLLYIKDGVTTGIATINTLDEEFSLLSSVAMIRPSKGLVDALYLKYLLNFPTFYEKIRTSMGGAAITRLTLVKIKNIEIPLPPHDLQIKFSLILKHLEKMKNYQKQSKEHIENLFNNIIQKSFKGELTC